MVYKCQNIIIFLRSELNLSISVSAWDYAFPTNMYHRFSWLKWVLETNPGSQWKYVSIGCIQTCHNHVNTYYVLSADWPGLPPRLEASPLSPEGPERTLSILLKSYSLPDLLHCHSSILYHQENAFFISSRRTLQTFRQTYHGELLRSNNTWFLRGSCWERSQSNVTPS